MNNIQKWFEENTTILDPLKAARKSKVIKEAINVSKNSQKVDPDIDNILNNLEIKSKDFKRAFSLYSSIIVVGAPTFAATSLVAHSFYINAFYTNPNNIHFAIGCATGIVATKLVTPLFDKLNDKFKDYFKGFVIEPKETESLKNFINNKTNNNNNNNNKKRTP